MTVGMTVGMAVKLLAPPAPTLMERIRTTDWLKLSYEEKITFVRKLHILRTDAIYDSRTTNKRTKSADNNIAKRSQTKQPKTDIDKLTAMLKADPKLKAAALQHLLSIQGN